MELLPILHKMRATGIRVDEEKAGQLKKEFKKKESELLSKLKKKLLWEWIFGLQEV